jgi:hypothetical protein
MYVGVSRPIVGEGMEREHGYQVSLARALFGEQDESVAHHGVHREALLDLAQLQTLAPKLHLAILPPNKIDGAVAVVSHEITSFVQPEWGWLRSHILQEVGSVI